MPKHDGYVIVMPYIDFDLVLRVFDVHTHFRGDCPFFKFFFNKSHSYCASCNFHYISYVGLSTKF